MLNGQLKIISSGKPKISIVICFNNHEILRENLIKSLEQQHNINFELIAVDNTEKKFSSIPSALNYGGHKATGDYIMFVHQDIFLCGENWLNTAFSLLSALPALGAAGVAGLDSTGMETGFILDRGRYWGRPLSMPMPVQTLDEQLIIIPRIVFEKIQFDENFNYHLYGADYCLSVQSLGLKVYVLPLFVEHNSLSIGTLKASSIQQQEKILIKKHKGKFKTIHKTTGHLGGKRVAIKRFFTLSSDFYLVVIEAFLKLLKVSMDKKTIIDIGCLPIEQISMKRRLERKLFSVGVSQKKRYLVISKKLGIHDDYVVVDPEKLPFRTESFDIAFFSGLLEYLSKEKAELTLSASEKIAKMSLVRVYCNTSSKNFMCVYFEGGLVLEQSSWDKDYFKRKHYQTLSFWINRKFPRTLYAFKSNMQRQNV
ncbi:MAG: glycosyltransferase [Candidatus Bathyarchaeota archaeon]|nr:glycosyltransferase [Candidatus Bathyarchaeota archaeon]